MIKLLLIMFSLLVVCSSCFCEGKTTSEYFSDFRSLLYENKKYTEKLSTYENPSRIKKDSLLEMLSSYNDANFDNPYLHMLAIDLYLETRNPDYLENVALRIGQVPIILTRMLEHKELALEMNIPEITISIIKQGLVKNGYIWDNGSLGLLLKYADTKSVQDFLIFYPSLQLTCLEMNRVNPLTIENKKVILQNLQDYITSLNNEQICNRFDLETRNLTQQIQRQLIQRK
jgi:hypothetical protein